MKPCGHTSCGCAAGGRCCLKCRLPRCLEDDTPIPAFTAFEANRAAIAVRVGRLVLEAQAANRAGESPDALAARYHVSVRTVRRWLAASPAGGP